MHAAGVDDAPPASIQHVGDSMLGGMEGGRQADGEDVIPLVLGELLNGRHKLDAGIVAAFKK